jgi:hypothetical protein
LNYWKISFGCLAGLVLAVASCSHPGGGSGGSGSGGSNGSGGSGSCSPGTLGCPCDDSGSCSDGLQCANLPGGETCVMTASGSGGNTATGGNGAGGSGTGGTVASGGSTGTGGAATGGNTGAGGAAGAASSGTGGAATGGNSGTGGGAAGSPGTGGAATGGNTGSAGSGSGDNLIVNGDFSQSDTNWHFENGTATANNGQYCATNITSGGLFGWQNMTTPLMLSGSQSYTLSYQASGSNNAALHVKVAHADSPYTPDDYDPMNNNQTVNDTLGASLQTFTHTFTPAMGDDSDTGVAFFVESGQNICLAKVSLVQN